ncbi:MAG: Hsp20/alpha crystallin family protein [Nitrospira defluvii]|nr:Hsp20/alpha crystallin family protein [Nitrospira defluvii]
MAKDKAKAKEKDTKAVAVKKPDEILTRWDDMDRWFDRMTEGFWPRPFSGLPSLFGKERLALPSVGLRMPTIDLYEDKDVVVVKADIPGLAKEEIELMVSGDLLTIKGEKKKEEEEEVKEKDYYRRERSYGSFARTVQLPCEVKGDDIKANFKDGVLEIRCPKTEDAKKKSVTVRIE